MARTDAKNKGRFNTDTVTNQISDSMEGWREGFGDFVRYYKLNQQASEWDDTFLEATGAGRVYNTPVDLQCQHVTHPRGENENGEYGFYHNDDLVLQVSYTAFTGAGMILPDIDNGQYIRDRVLYDNLIFRVTKMAIEGKIRQRPNVIQIQCTQMKPDELVDDPQFAQWSA